MLTAARFRKRVAVVVATVIGVAGVGLAVGGAHASASTVVMGPTATGGFRDDGLSTSSTYFVGRDGAGHQTRNYMTFDIRNVTRPVDSATIVLTNGSACAGFASFGAPDYYELHPVGVDPHDLTKGGYLPGDGTGKGIFSSLGSIPRWGQQPLSDPNQDPVTIAFNATGLAGLNAARGGILEVGGTYAEGATGPQYIFAGTNPTCRVLLQLHLAPQDQTITFPNPGPRTYGDAPVGLGATATSGLDVSYAVKSGPCAFLHSLTQDHKLVLTGAGNCVVAATQAGDEDWNAAPEVDDTIVINKAATFTSLTANPPDPSLGQPVTLTATVEPLADRFSGPTPATGSVTFFIDGTATATVPLTHYSASTTVAFAGGSHTVTAKYSGDVNFLASDSASSDVTVRCDRTLTGAVSAVTATSGLTCINRATVSGGISVAKGAALDLERSTVKGSISANAPAGIRICGSTTGAIAVSGATGAVVIGDPRGINLCAANKISSGITVANNIGPVVVVGNTVPGVTAANNTGGQTITGNHP